MARGLDRSQIERDVDRVMGAPSLPIVEREAWPDGTEIVWLGSPFPYERKPFVPSSVHKNQRVGRVDLSALIGTQRRVTRHGVDRYADPGRRAPGSTTEDLPLVYHASSGKTYIADGHHRLVAARLRGDRTARVRIAEIGELDR